MGHTLPKWHLEVGALLANLQQCLWQV